MFYDRDSPNTNATRADAEIAQQQPTRKPAMAPGAASNYLLIGNLVDFTGATGRSGQAWGQATIDSANWINENGGVAGKLFDLDTIETSYIVRRALPAYEKWLSQDVLAIQGFGNNIGLALRDKAQPMKSHTFPLLWLLHSPPPMAAPESQHQRPIASSMVHPTGRLSRSA